MSIRRSLNEEIEEKNNAFREMKIEFDEITDKCKESQRKMDELNSELQKFTLKRAHCRREISEQQNQLQMETPSLQAKFEELNSIEKEIRQLEELKKVIIFSSIFVYKKIFDFFKSV